MQPSFSLCSSSLYLSIVFFSLKISSELKLMLLLLCISRGAKNYLHSFKLCPSAFQKLPRESKRFILSHSFKRQLLFTDRAACKQRRSHSRTIVHRNVLSQVGLTICYTAAVGASSGSTALSITVGPPISDEIAMFLFLLQGAVIVQFQGTLTRVTAHLANGWLLVLWVAREYTRHNSVFS